jgi:hypothetical protein
MLATQLDIPSQLGLLFLEVNDRLLFILHANMTKKAITVKMVSVCQSCLVHVTMSSVTNVDAASGVSFLNLKEL